jgi:ADP-ribose pyrophosphatase
VSAPDDKRIELIERRNVYAGHFRVDVLRLRHGQFQGGMGPEIRRELIDRGHAVAVLPYDAARDEVVLIEQFRVAPYSVGDEAWMLEAIAGLIEDGEDAQDVVRREAEEEAGLKLTQVDELLTIYTSPGALSERITIYHAPVDASQADGIHGVAEEGEDIRVVVLPFAEAMNRLATGRITSGPSVVALQWLALNRARLRGQEES